MRTSARKLMRFSCAGLILRGTLAVMIAVALSFMPTGAVPSSFAQGFAGILESYSPLFSLPCLQGEARVRPIWVGISSGNEYIPSLGIAWNLREQFALMQTNLFIDSMIRFQLGRFSFRINYDPRDFVASTTAVYDPLLREGSARLNCSGLRLGGDLDIVQWYRSRAGVNIDYDLFSPIFSESIQTFGGKQIIGQAALTLGIHLVAMPATNLYGVSPVFEARCRWPSLGTEVTDLEISGGLRSPETILGAVALKGGYRRTNLEFTRSQIFNGIGVSTTLDATMSGGFVEFAYYY